MADVPVFISDMKCIYKHCKCLVDGIYGKNEHHCVICACEPRCAQEPSVAMADGAPAVQSAFSLAGVCYSSLISVWLYYRLMFVLHSDGSLNSSTSLFT